MTKGVDEVHSIGRALYLLEILNRQPVTSVRTLHYLTGVPKPTLVRFLGTLAAAGYVHQVSRLDGYTVTEKVLRLSAGFRFVDAIVHAARPQLDNFTRRYKWQISLATFDANAMRVRYNTHHLSPFATEWHRLNRRVSILDSTLGRAYLAYCSDAERELVVRWITKSSVLYDGLVDERYVDEVAEATRSKGYATVESAPIGRMSRGPIPNGRIRSFAVPVLSGESGTALGSMAMFYFGSTMTESEAVERHLGEMQDIARQIAFQGEPRGPAM